jgi:hypothetical protein
MLINTIQYNAVIRGIYYYYLFHPKLQRITIGHVVEGWCGWSAWVFLL